MHLSEYRRKQNLSQKDFGELLEPAASPSLVSQWECGITRITLAYALEIGRKTGDQVTPADCDAMFTEPHDRVPGNEKATA